MPRTPPIIGAVITAILLSMYASRAAAQGATPTQGAAPPTGQPAQAVAGTSNEDLTKAVYSALNADPNHFFRHVTVSVENGVATLSGFVHSSSSIYRANTIAGKVPGVTRVVNDVKLEPNRPR